MIALNEFKYPSGKNWAIDTMGYATRLELIGKAEKKKGYTTYKLNL